MSDSPLPHDHPAVKFGRIGVLLLNLGTPEGTGYWPMRRYLKEFLWDKRVIEVPRLIWWLILNLIILTTRPGRKGKDYASIWNNERNEGPLKTITRAQAEKLQTAIGNTILVDWAMRYGFPDIKSRLNQMLENGCEKILLVPLYPQYAAATTATACDHTFRALMQMRWQPTIRVCPPYHDDKVYIEAIAASIENALATLDFTPEKILLSFHGVPKKYLLKGDPYHCHCAKTARLVTERLKLEEGRVIYAFQSRFGNDEWLQPYTDKTVERLAKEGIKSLAIVAPGFSADCLETLEELDVENREIFMHAGGEKFKYISCLNDTPAGMQVIEHLVRRELQGWV